MIILVDIDDTLWDHISIWCHKLNIKYGTHVAIEDITDWDMSKFWPGLDLYSLYEPIFDPDIWSEVCMLPGAIKGLKTLKDKGHEIYIVTATHYKNVSQKLIEFKRRVPFIDSDHFIITSNKQLIKGDILIDDGLHNILQGNYEKILMDKPWNRMNDDVATGVHRVFSWEDIPPLVDKINSFHS